VSDPNPTDWSPQISAGLMYIGLASIFTAIFKDMALDPSRPGPPPQTRREHMAMLRFKLASLIFGVVCFAVGLLMQIYWIEPVRP
jgi:hypothetical protein